MRYSSLFLFIVSIIPRYASFKLLVDHRAIRILKLCATDLDNGDDDYNHRFHNIEGLYGPGCLSRLRSSHVCIIGLGGVGSWACEALARYKFVSENDRASIIFFVTLSRSGIGHFTLIDIDDICISNVNRQIQALSSNIGKFKVDALRDRIQDINPNALVKTYYEFVRKENVDSFINEAAEFNVMLRMNSSFIYK